MTNRDNQDKYDVIQAREEYESMHRATNNTSQDEPVLTLEQWAQMQAQIDFLTEELRRRDEEE